MMCPHAGWPALKAIDILVERAAHLPLEVVNVAKEIARIPNPGARKTVAEAIMVLVGEAFGGVNMSFLTRPAK